MTFSIRCSISETTPVQHKAEERQNVIFCILCMFSSIITWRFSCIRGLSLTWSESPVRRSSFASPVGRRRTGSVFRGASGGPGALAPLVSGVPSDFSAATAALDEFGRGRSRSIGRPLVEGRLSSALRRESVSFLS